MDFDPSKTTEQVRIAWEGRIAVHGVEAAAGQFNAIVKWVNVLKADGMSPQAIREYIVGMFWDTRISMGSQPTLNTDSVRLVEAMLSQIFENSAGVIIRRYSRQRPPNLPTPR